ncbi:MAG: leucine-rich repeat domain-containing protein [Bacteroidaceae bacterium]|nr:leucine-rich repeat domain-containing protein [Bacteroidaceae bacterium]
MNKLRSVKLPHNLLTIADRTFYNCRNLEKVKIPSTVKSIGSSAFYNTNIDSIIIPEGIKTIENYTFQRCFNLKYVSFPKGLERIGDYAFENTNIEKIIFPTTLKHIGRNAFEENNSVSEVRIPSSVQSISDNAFNGCNNLKKVYTYTVEPTQISENTFSASTFKTAMLYVPSVSYYNYYWDDGWKRFLNLDFFDEPYEYFYLNSDKVLNNNTGYIEGEGDQNPDADINPGGGLIVEGEQEDSETPNQNLGDVNVENDGAGNSGSIMGDNNLWVDNLNIKINVKGGRWYFFAFPFDIKLDKITLENGSRCVWRYYDGEERANGKTGWKDVNGNKLNAAQGYIFQSSADDVLVLNIEGIRFKKEDKYNELVAHMSDNLKDASWNFMGNPYLSYYDMNDMEYSAPVTVWDGSKYVAIRPGDDDYHFTPFEAFFVQKPEGESNVGFEGDAQMTQTQSNDKKAKQAAARKMMVMNARAQENPRKLVNLTLTAGEVTDGTRIVFNNAQSRAYESECDAAKFETQGVIQLFTIGDQQERYAINERPADNGIVMLGFTAPSAGEFSISASRMDTPVYLKDRETGALVDLSKGAYNFTAKAGTNVNRFEVLMEATVTGINQVGTTEGEDAKVYDLGGRRVKENGKGVYIINGEKTLVK